MLRKDEIINIFLCSDRWEYPGKINHTEEKKNKTSFLPINNAYQKKVDQIKPRSELMFQSNFNL